jgi:mRNA-degrading endonuclease RelE of RelBE toxin-antitoxin system
MQFLVTLSPSAAEDLDYFSAFEQRVIMAAIHRFLTTDARIETKRRKRLQDNPIAPWGLKRGNYRIFYDILDPNVDMLAIGYKEHNDLFIRGRKVAL